MSNLTKASSNGEKAEAIMLTGDLSKLTDDERAKYIVRLCESLGLNPLTRPFEYVTLKGKFLLYARKDCTEQLRKLYGVSLTIVSRETTGKIHVVTARATMPDGRCDESVGAVPLSDSMSADDYANAIMKAECVPLEYQMLTRDGFKHALELSPGDEVASVDAETASIHWTPLEAVSIYEGQRVTRYGNSAFEVEMTAGHKWIAETPDGRRRLVPFEDIKTGIYLRLAATSHDVESLLSPQEAALLGWIVTDGTIKKYKGVNYRASVSQSKKENFEHIDWACQSVGTVTRTVTDNRDHGWMDQHFWLMSVKQTRSLFAKAGFESNEDLPRIVTRLSADARESMLEAMMRADGDKRGNFGKSKTDVIACFQTLCALTGHLTSKTTTRLNMKGQTKPFYLSRKMSYNKVARQNLEELESRETTVWCPTTKHGTWICKSDQGQVFVTGNTKAKRRVTLSICGLGITDESELDTIQGVQIAPPPRDTAIDDAQFEEWGNKIATAATVDELLALAPGIKANVASERTREQLGQAYMAKRKLLIKELEANAKSEEAS